jgi:SAM-dependent methyltransferase
LPPRFDAECPGCASLERHRLLFLCDAASKLFTRELDVVHFAPEPAVRAFVEPRVARYRSADLHPGRAELTLNIERIALPDASVDTVIASHVLEHVDDEAALREVRRILKPGGRAILMFPVVEGWDATYENDAVVGEEDRLLHFGQHDHVRYYGRDVRERIRGADLALEEFCGDAAACLAHGLIRGERVFIATKPPP